MPDQPNLATPPDVGAWTAQRTEADTGTAVETPPAAPVVEEPVAPGTEEPRVEAPPASATPAPAEQIVAAMVKSGMTAPDAQKLLDSARTPQPIKDAIEALLDGKPYPVPKNLTFNLKSGTTVTQKTLEQLQREGMLLTDYQRKTQETAQLRRQLEQRIIQADASAAAAKAREEWLREREQEMIEAQKDPKAWEDYQEMMRLRSSNPRIARMFDDALATRESNAKLTTYEEQQQAREVQNGAEQAVQWITELAPQYPTVNPERVRFLYAYALEHGQITQNSPEAIRQVFEGEQGYIKSAASPLEAQLAEMRTQLEALTTTKAAEAHNAKTARALDRAKAPNTAPGGGGPPAPARLVERKPIPPVRQDIDKAISDWTKVRDE